MIALVILIGLSRAGIPSVTDHREEEAQSHDCRGNQKTTRPSWQRIAQVLLAKAAEDQDMPKTGVLAGASRRGVFSHRAPPEVRIA
jgi:hypothetical protein